MELLAQVIEGVSILTTKKYATKKPREVRRPAWVKNGGSDKQEAEQTSNPFARAIDRVLGVGPPRQARGGEYVGTPPPHLREAVT